MIKTPNIITRYHGATEYKPSRISASAEGVERIYLPYNHHLTAEGNHAAAARELATRNGWEEGRKIERTDGIELHNGKGYAFVFTLNR
jgi:hypothetical protein